MNHHLELTPATIDETLGQLRYVVYSAATEAAVGAVMEHGLRVREGMATISAALAVNNGYQVILRRPRQPYLGYATATTAVLERSAKTVSGNPLEYARARRELGWYTNDSLQLTSGSEVLDLTVASDFLIGWIEPTVTLAATLAKLDVSAQTLAPVQFGPMEQELSEAIVFAPGASQVSAIELAHALIISTLESSVLEQLRNLRWRGLSLLGYRFSERGDDITIAPAKNFNEQQLELNGLQERLNGESMLVGELAWLAPHIQSAVTVMNNELHNPLPDSPR